MIRVLMKSHVLKEYDEISETSCVRQNLTVQCAWPDFRKSQSESLLLRKQQTKNGPRLAKTCLRAIGVQIHLCSLVSRFINADIVCATLIFARF